MKIIKIYSMKFFLFSCLFFGAISFTIAQKNKSNYHFTPQISLLNGDQSVSGQMSLIGVWEKNKWGFGLGAAIDYYKVRTAPFFFTSHYYLNQLKQLAVYTSLGLNIAWPLENQYTNNLNRGGWGNIEHEGFTNGGYADMGIRYSLFNKKLNGLSIAIGYSMKTAKENFIETIFMPVIGGTPNPVIVPRTLEYKFNRIAITIGYRL